MSFKNIVISGVVATLLSSSAYAALEMDGSGDYLIAPSTIATQNDGWITNLKIVNTNTTHAIVARVVVRNGSNSQELFDFPLYLTPSDAWEGTLRHGSDELKDITGAGTAGKLVITSNDDSSMVWEGSAGHINRANVDGTITYTSPKAEYLKGDLVGYRTNLTDDELIEGREKTYVEVYGLRAYDAIKVPLDAGLPDWQVGTALDKVSFFEYARDVTEGEIKTQVAPQNFLNNLYPTDVNTLIDVDNDSLIGKQVIRDLSGKLNMALNMVALGDISAEARWDNVIGPDTTLSSMSSDPIAAVNNMIDSLSKDKIFVMNEGTADGKANTMRVQFTDPVKKYIAETRDISVMNPNYLYEDLDDTDIYLSEWYYTFTQDAHNMSEEISNCHDVGSNSDISGIGFDSKICNPTKVHKELYRDFVFAEDLQSTPYFFPAGGFMTFYMDQNTTVIPTALNSVKTDAGDVNYHISNQYIKGSAIAHVNP